MLLMVLGGGMMLAMPYLIKKPRTRHNRGVQGTTRKDQGGIAYWGLEDRVISGCRNKE